MSQSWLAELGHLKDRLSLSRSGAGRLAAVSVVLAGAGALLTGCGSTPHQPELTPSSTPAVKGAHSTAYPPDHITLPETIELNFDHPTPDTPDQRAALYTVQQAIKARLHAVYAASAHDPLLAKYWADGGLEDTQAWVTGWLTSGEEPVGRVDITNTSIDHVDPSSATVTFCDIETNVYRGFRKTHTLGDPVQKPNTPGDEVTLGLSRGNDGAWRATSINTTLAADHCK